MNFDRPHGQADPVDRPVLMDGSTLDLSTDRPIEDQERGIEAKRDN